jgi:hypothetical protein
MSDKAGGDESDLAKPARTTAPNPAGGRAFFSSTTVAEFFDELRGVLEEQHAQTLRSLEILASEVRSLTSTVEKLINATIPTPRIPTSDSPPVPSSQPAPQTAQSHPSPKSESPLPRASTGNQPGSYSPREPPPATPPPSTLPVSPSRPPYRAPPLQLSNSPHPPTPYQKDPLPPVPSRPRGNEETAITSATEGSTAFVSGGGDVSGIKLRPFRGRDGENVVSWLNQAEQFFEFENIAEDLKVAVVSFFLKDTARHFHHYCFVRNNNIELTSPEFQDAFRRKFEVPPHIRGRRLREKLRDLPFDGPRHMFDYCEKFRQIESQIYDMAFPDRLDYFLEKFAPGSGTAYYESRPRVSRGYGSRLPTGQTMGHQCPAFQARVPQAPSS